MAKTKPAAKTAATTTKKKTTKALDLKSIAQKAKQLKEQQGGGDFLKLTDGENRLRIVPFEHDGEEHLFVEFHSHYVNDIKKSYKCLRDIEEDCPICLMHDALSEAGATDTAKRFRARTRFVFNVAQGGSLYVLELGGGVVSDILGYFGDEDYGNIADLEDGRDIKIIKTGSGLDTEYEVRVVPNQSEAKFTGNPKDLFKLITYPNLEEVESDLESVFNTARQSAEEEIGEDLPF